MEEEIYNNKKDIYEIRSPERLIKKFINTEAWNYSDHAVKICEQSKEKKILTTILALKKYNKKT